MESRALRYFVAVGEELNFARAAERLGISPPPLSRAIRKLEDELAVTLFERTTRAVVLTDAGVVLLDEARGALSALDAAGRRAQRAAESKLVLAVKADSDAGMLEVLLANYADDPAATPVVVQFCGWGEQAQLLRDGYADAALIPEPFDRTGLDAETIATERRVVALAAHHPLAARTEIELADLGLSPEPLELQGQLDELVAQYGVRDLPQLLQQVELGDLVTLLPESVVSRYPRDGVAYRVVPDSPPAKLSIAWPQLSRSTATAALVRAASR
ncbi:LysR family transcriptional regulator [Kribbella italica]|uniref:DNA-binding transcriptional LysR family regulator n=1 Tax=Kribbella italica TaxID=1540520 RepID=A0A7W9J4M9_9ACTN|nr:DNA-binding transcriptional LysR family regulator [Kribbella italica]